MEQSQSNKKLVSSLMYIHANINRTQASKENYLLLSSLLVSLLWGLCRVRYSGWALLSTPWKHASRCGTRNDFFPSFEERHTWFSYIIHHSIIFLERSKRNILFLPREYILEGIQSVEEEEFNSWKTFNLLVTRCYFAAMFAKRWRWFRHSIEAFFPSR